MMTCPLLGLPCWPSWLLGRRRRERTGLLDRARPPDDQRHPSADAPESARKFFKNAGSLTLSNSDVCLPFMLPPPRWLPPQRQAAPRFAPAIRLSI